jgi:hypothetical protein
MCGTFHTRMRQSSVAPIVKVVVGFSQIANCLTPALPEPCSILRLYEMPAAFSGYATRVRSGGRMIEGMGEGHES